MDPESWIITVGYLLFCFFINFSKSVTSDYSWNVIAGAHTAVSNDVFICLHTLLQPSHAEKAAKPEIKKFMMELSRARKEAKSKIHQ